MDHHVLSGGGNHCYSRQWLARAGLFLRYYLLTNIALFLIFTVGCAFTSNLGEMIVVRAFQGFSGGVLIPLAFSIIMTRLPPSKHPTGLEQSNWNAAFHYTPAMLPTSLATGIIMLASVVLSDHQFFEDRVCWDPSECQIACKPLTPETYVMWLHPKVRSWGRLISAPFGV